MLIDFIYDEGCPNIELARQNLTQALEQLGLPAQWQEFESSQPDLPDYARGFGSPSILVGAKDVAGEQPGSAPSCRLYAHGEGPSGAPSVAQICRALDRFAVAPAPTPPLKRNWKSSMPALPAIGIALLPKLACPACWPAYAGLLSALGLTILIDETVLFSLTAGFLVIAVGALGWRAKNRRGLGPFWIGLMASLIVLIGKFEFEIETAMYGGITLLVAASLWNAWPKPIGCGDCPEVAVNS